MPSVVWILAGTVTLVISLIVGLAWLSVDQGYQRYRERAVVATQNLSRLLEQNIASVLDKSDALLRATVQEIEDRLAHGEDKASINQFLVKQSTFMPEAESLRATDTQGNIVYGLGVDNGTIINITDRESFTILRDDPSRDVVFEGPNFSRINKKWVVVIGRRVKRPDGSFAGMVYVTIPAAHFQRRFAEVNLGANGAISLRTSDLRLVARFPDPPGASAIGSRNVSSQLQDALRANPDSGTYVAKTALDQIERTNAYLRVSGYPLHVIIGFASVDDYNAWWKETRTTAALAALAVLAVLLSSWLIQRSWKRQSVATESLARESHRNEVLLRTASDGIYILDGEGNLLVASDAFAAMLGYERDAMTGMSIVQWAGGGTGTTPQDRLARLLASDGASVFETRHRRRDGSLIDVEISVRRVEYDDSPALFASARDITARKHREKRDRIQGEIFRLLASDGSLTELLTLVIEHVEASSDGLACAIFLLAEPGGPLVRGTPSGESDVFDALPDRLALNAWVDSGKVSRDEAVVVDGVQAEPIRDADGGLLGAFAVDLHRRDPLDETERGFIHEAVVLASIVIVRNNLEKELQLTSSVYRASGEAIMVTDADNRILAVNPAFSKLTDYAPNEVLKLNPKILASGHTSQEYYQEMWRDLALTGHWQGEIRDRRKNGEEFVAWLTINTLHDEHGTLIRRIAMFSDITKRKLAEDQIWRQANYDTLTGLPNRRLVRDHLQREMKKCGRSGLSLALLFIDLDRFKDVNDTLGHDVGDRLLVEAARRISRCVRESDTVARLGGDEFTVLLPEMPTDNRRVEQVAQAILTTLALPFELGGEIAYISASIGITFYPTDAGDIETVLRNADQAMYVAKNQGRNCFSYFTEALQEAARTRMHLGNDLRRALGLGQLELYYQPILDLATGRIVKAEALLRWHHPTDGLVLPAQFIPIAEDIGIIHEIGDWVFREAARAAVHWRARGFGDIKVGVNTSPRQFVMDGAQEAWPDYLSNIGLPAESMVVEITEGLLLDDRPAVTERLLKFRDAGMAVAIDDFGTGYSAMSYLKKYHIDYVKIDQSFVRDIDTDPGDLAIAEAIIVMAHKLGIAVIAEGVENPRQRNLLLGAGCDFAQGFLFSLPLPAVEFEALLERAMGEVVTSRQT